MSTPVPVVTVHAEPLQERAAELLVVGAFAPSGEDEDAPPELSDGAAAVGGALEVDLAQELRAVGFDGRVGSTVRVPTRGRLQAAAVLVAGLGVRSDASPVELRRTAAAVAQAATRVERIATDLHRALGGDEEVAAEALTEGILLGAYRYDAFKSDPTPQVLAHVDLAAADVDAAQRGVASGTAVAAGVRLTRDLVNTPPQAKRPPALADRVVAEVEGTGITATVLDEAALAEGGYGGILGVGQGSQEPPRLVELRYEPPTATRHVALVGKGITFDTGGISLKPSSGMETMKMDMAGAATVAGVMTAAAALQLPVRITGLLALAENMPSGTATRVSDVLTMKDGSTVEVMNTDAEGRLVLADALRHAGELEPDAIVDIATLTGAALIALGERIGAVIGTDDDLADALLDASAAAGEAFWRLPLAREHYAERLESDTADVKNVAGRSAGTITAALFLSRFVDEGQAWAHLDVAGVAWSDAAYDEVTKGGTGVPVRTLLRWLREG